MTGPVPVRVDAPVKDVLLGLVDHVSAELPIRGACIEDDQPHPAETQDPGLLIMRLVLA